MQTRIVTARVPKRIRKPTMTGPKLSRVIVGKPAPAPETPEAHQARGDAADRLWREMVASVSRKNPPAYEAGGKCWPFRMGKERVTVPSPADL